MSNRIWTVALAAGLLAGLAAAVFQLVWATPLILEAEVYEAAGAMTNAPVPAQGEQQGWDPADGLERSFFTVVSHVLLAVGFALLLAGIFALRQRDTLKTGFFWGLAGFVVFHGAPALGLPPELPGTAAADLLACQAWWSETVVCTATGLGLLIFVRQGGLRLLGLPLLALPHALGAPPAPGVHAALAPAALRTEFLAASLVTNAVMWLVLGSVSGFLFYRDRRKQPSGSTTAIDPPVSRI